MVESCYDDIGEETRIGAVGVKDGVEHGELGVNGHHCISLQTRHLLCHTFTARKNGIAMGFLNTSRRFACTRPVMITIR